MTESLDAVPSIQAYETFGGWLAARVAHMKERNPTTSMRALAKRARLSSSLLAMIARDERHPTDDVLSRLALVFDLRQEDVQFASALVGFRRAKSVATRQRHAARLRELRPTHTELLLSLDQIEMISHWRHVTILELTQLSSFVEDPEVIAARLGSFTTPEMVVESIELLLRLGLLRRLDDGKLTKTAAQTRTPRKLPSAAIRGYHKQMLQRAHAAIDRQEMAEMFFAGLTIPVPSSRLPEIKQRIADFRDQLAASLGEERASADEIYHLNIQFFRATTTASKG